MNVITVDTAQNSTVSGVNPGSWVVYMGNIIRAFIVVDIILGMFYLLMLSSLSTQGFGLEILKAEKIERQKELEMVEIALAIPSSIYALESNEVVQLLPEAGDKFYLHVRDSELAMR